MLDRSKLVLGVTGPTGSGKTTLCQEAKKLGANVIHADEVSRKVLECERDCVDQLVKAFSKEILSPQNKIDRSLLAQKAFSSKENTQLLNRITHPFIVKKIKLLIDNYKDITNNIIIVDAPLLFESGLDKECDVILSVIAPESVRLQRIIERDNITFPQAIARVKAQNKDDFYKEKSDFVIDGLMSKQDLKVFLVDFMKKLGKQKYK